MRRHASSVRPRPPGRRPPPPGRRRWASCTLAWATSSATDRSMSWPMPVSTGTSRLATARAMVSPSNAARSVVAPPPRTSSTASTPRAATARRPQATDRGAWAPCTRTSAVVTENPMPDRRSSSSTSCSAALPRLVTSPSRSGRTGRGSAACRVSSPSPSSVRSRRSRSAARRPSVKAGSMSDIWSCSRPPRSYQVTRARSRTSVPSVMRTPPPASVSRALTRRRAVSNSTTGQAGQRRAGQVALGRRLDQVEPHRAAPPAGVEVADDAPHPHLVGEGGAQPEADGLAQLGDRPGGVAGVVPQRGRARGGWHARRTGRATGTAGRGTTSHTPSR